MMRIFLWPILALFMLAFATSLQAHGHKPTLVGVLFYADWCGTCKTLDPEIQKARSEGDLDSQSILFVRMDYTNEVTTHQSELLAQSLGLGEIYQANDGKTGYMMLFDPETSEEVARITKKHKADKIAELIQTEIKKRQS